MVNNGETPARGYVYCIDGQGHRLAAERKRLNILGLAFQSLCGAVAISSVALCAQAVPATQSADAPKEHVLLIMTDGLRWQEVFRGADPTLLTKANNNDQPVDALAKVYLHATPEERRAALMPFLWSHIAPEGEIYGNRDKGSVAYVTNGLKLFLSRLQRDPDWTPGSRHHQQRQCSQSQRNCPRVAQPRVADQRSSGPRPDRGLWRMERHQRDR